MSISEATRLKAAVATNRFGLGARPGDLDAAAADPQGFLLDQIRSTGADQPEGALPDAAASLEVYRQDRIRARALKLKAADEGKGAGAAGASDAAMAAAEPSASMAPATLRAPDASASAALRTEGGADALRQERREIFQSLRALSLAEIGARTALGAATPAGFRERWTLFWANHFTVSAKKPQASALAGPFEREAIRPHVFARFEDLLVASSTHPGMLLYLDQARSVGPDSAGGVRAGAGLNENLAREILELHTVGAEGGYGQADVTEFARALTGFSIARGGERGRQEGAFLWRAAIHEPGPRTVMGRAYASGEEDQALRILADLARSPRTARRLSRKIAVHFVSDDPPASLVDRLAAAYARSDGDLAVLARTLVASPEAWGPERLKFKTPNDFVLSSWRAAGAVPHNAQETAQSLQLLGQRPFAAIQPNGWGDQAQDWISGGAVLRRLSWASAFAGRNTPAGRPLEVADAALGPAAAPALRTAMARAETPSGAFALLLMSPEFQRR